MANHVQKDHAVALKVRAEDFAVSAFRALYDVSTTEKEAVKRELQVSHLRTRPMRGATQKVRRGGIK